MESWLSLGVFSEAESGEDSGVKEGVGIAGGIGTGVDIGPDIADGVIVGSEGLVLGCRPDFLRDPRLLEDGVGVAEGAAVSANISLMRRWNWWSDLSRAWIYSADDSVRAYKTILG